LDSIYTGNVVQLFKVIWD